MSPAPSPMESSATPRPWACQPVDTDGPDYGVTIIGVRVENGIVLETPTNGLVGCALPWPTEIDSGDFARVEANARLIVKAVNSHEALVEALRDARAVIASLDEFALGGVDVPDAHTGEAIGQYGIRDELLSKIDAALSKSEGK